LASKQKMQISRAEEEEDALRRKIEYITQYNSICDYILAEQTQMNIKESTKEAKIKVLIWLSKYF
jgi:hypothetical protein